MPYKSVGLEINAYEAAGSHKGSTRYTRQIECEHEFDHHFVAGLLDEIILIIQTRIEDYESHRAEETEED